MTKWLTTRSMIVKDCLGTKKKLNKFIGHLLLKEKADHALEISQIIIAYNDLVAAIDNYLKKEYNN